MRNNKKKKKLRNRSRKRKRKRKQKQLKKQPNQKSIHLLNQLKIKLLVHFVLKSCMYQSVCNLVIIDFVGLAWRSWWKIRKEIVSSVGNKSVLLSKILPSIILLMIIWKIILMIKGIRKTWNKWIKKIFSLSILLILSKWFLGNLLRKKHKRLRLLPALSEQEVEEWPGPPAT